MKSAKAGHASSAVEVVNISREGIRLLVRDRELFLSFREFPWFEDATVRELSLVELLGADHLHWPALDADVSIDSVEHPERYPLVFRGDPARVRETPSLNRSNKGRRQG